MKAKVHTHIRWVTQMGNNRCSTAFSKQYKLIDVAKALRAYNFEQNQNIYHFLWALGGANLSMLDNFSAEI